MRVLCVAEKPSISKSITQILSGGQFTTRNTATNYVKNYDFNYNYTHSTFTVTCVAGHLMEYDFHDTHRKWQSCDPIALFDAPIESKTAKDKTAIAQNIRNEARRADQLMIWTDCDREGENIGWEIMTIAQNANRNIVVKRARFSAIIAQQIHNAAQHPIELDLLQAAAVTARINLDLRIGAAFTRMQTMALRDRLEKLKEAGVISYGPCQFPTLGFVVSRYNQVQSFVPEAFWYIYLSIEPNAGSSKINEEVQFTWRRGHLFEFEVALVIYEVVLASPRARVTKVTKKNTKKWKPLPLTTVELQKAGSRLLKLAPKKILDIAEKLYQQGFLSYPRTETDQYDPQFDFMSLIEKQNVDPEWGQFAHMLQTQDGFSAPRKGKNNDHAHPPIHPTAHAANLGGDEKRVYEFIVRRFLACCSKDALGFQTTVDVLCGGEEFYATGLIILERNFLNVYPYEKWSGKELPDFEEGDEFMPSVCELREGVTSPPNLLTEADLVGLMDKNGIGTDATIAQHIETIIERGYVIPRPDGGVKYLVPSTLGIGLVDGYNEIGFEKSLSKPQLRRDTERNLVQVCRGQKSKTDMLSESIEQYKEMYILAKRDFPKIMAAVRRRLDGRGNAGVAGQGDGGGRGRGGARGAGRGGRGVGRGGRGGGNGGRGGGDDDSDNEGPGGGGGGGRGRGAARARGSTRAAAPASRGRATARGGAPRAPSPPPDMDEEEFFAPPPPPQKPQSTAAKSTVAKSAPTSTSNAASRAGPSRNTNANTSDEVRCDCGEIAIERTVTKESINKGRTFRKCATEKCSFFAWGDEPVASSSASTSAATRRADPMPAPVLGKRAFSERSDSRQSSRTAEEGPKRCNCDMTAITKAVTKDGANKGRSFWACPNVQVASCGFFEWVAEGVGDSGGGAGGRSSSMGEVKSGGCFKCGQEGHWASACPNPQGGSDSNKRFKSSGTFGDSGGIGNACFKCGEPGHYSNACPNPQGGSKQRAKSSGGGGGDNACFKCGESGHYSNACPNPGGAEKPASRSGSRGGKRGRGRGRGRTSGGKSRGKSSKSAGSMFGAADDFM